MNNCVDIEGFSGRLLTAIGSESVHSFAEKCKINDSTLRPYLKKGALPRMDRLIAMAEAANVSLEWLATGRGPMRPQGETKPERTNGAVCYLEDPLIKDIKLWLKEMTTDNPGWRTWFEMELLHKIPLFKEWRQKKSHVDSDDNSAAV